MFQMLRFKMFVILKSHHNKQWGQHEWMKVSWLGGTRNHHRPKHLLQLAPLFFKAFPLQLF